MPVTSAFLPPPEFLVPLVFSDLKASFRRVRILPPPLFKLLKDSITIAFFKSPPCQLWEASFSPSSLDMDVLPSETFLRKGNYFFPSSFG